MFIACKYLFIGFCKTIPINAIFKIKRGVIMSLDYNIIGERLKQARINKKLTQEKLAEQLDVSVAFLSRIERGSSYINLKRLNQICSILNVDEGEILNGVSKDSNGYLNKDLSNLIKNCPPEKISLIYNIAKVIVDS